MESERRWKMACPYLNGNDCQTLKDLRDYFFALHFAPDGGNLVNSGITSSGDEAVIEKVCGVNGEFKKCQEFQKRQLKLPF